MLSYPSSLQGHSDFPTPVTSILPVSPNLIDAYRRLEPCRDAGISGPTSVIFHRMPMAIPRVPCRCICPLLPCRLWPSPFMQRIGVYSDYLGFIPHPDSPSYIHPMRCSRGCTIRFMLRPAVLAGTPDWVKPTSNASRLGTVSGQVQPVCYHTNPPSAYTPIRATDVVTSFHVTR